MIPDHRTDQQKAEDRQKERELHKRGFVRCTPYIANLAGMYGVEMCRGPKLAGSKLDVGTFVPAWFEWHILRFPNGDDAQRARLERTKVLLHDKKEQLMLLLEGQLCSGAIYDPAGDVGTEHAIALLKEELND